MLVVIACYLQVLKMQLLQSWSLSVLPDALASQFVSTYLRLCKHLSIKWSPGEFSLAVCNAGYTLLSAKSWMYCRNDTLRWYVFIGLNCKMQNDIPRDSDIEPWSEELWDSRLFLRRVNRQKSDSRIKRAPTSRMLVIWRLFPVSSPPKWQHISPLKFEFY